VDIGCIEELVQREGPASELEEMGSYVGKKTDPRWLWHAIDHHSGKVLAYVFGRRKDEVFLQLQALLEPFGIRRFYTDGWGTYEHPCKGPFDYCRSARIRAVDTCVCCLPLSL
jgi:insertion element IS1 protein InsB